jgi:hypothetical protein
MLWLGQFAEAQRIRREPSPEAARTMGELLKSVERGTFGSPTLLCRRRNLRRQGPASRCRGASYSKGLVPCRQISRPELCCIKELRFPLTEAFKLSGPNGRDGHDERFPPSSLSTGCGFSKETFAGTRANEKDAPLATFRRAGGQLLSSQSDAACGHTQGCGEMIFFAFAIASA